MIEITRHTNHDLDEVDQFDELAPVLAWWRSTGAPPTVSAFSPFVIPTRLLPNTTLFDVEEGPRRYRVRLMGTAIADHFGGDATGRYLDEVFAPAAYDIVRSGFDSPVATGTPHFAARVYNTMQGREISFSRLVLPLADDRGRIIRLISASLMTKPGHAYSEIYRRARRSVVVSEMVPVA